MTSNTSTDCLCADEERSFDDDEFLVGPSVYLRSPSIDQDVLSGKWHSWFNDAENTKFLTHGVFPVKKEDQVAIVQTEMNRTSTLLLCIISKVKKCHIGVISLKNIDLINRTAEIGIVMAPNKIGGTPAFEAMALLIKHAFYRLNLDLLYAGQHEGLWKWVNSLSQLGFKIDGFRCFAGRRDRNPYGIFHTSVTAEDFRKLECERGGGILQPSSLAVLRQRPRHNPALHFRQSLNELNSQWISEESVSKGAK
jgi:RimJ/RimL family protein N-acetyltransferase